jgi:membrane fusion protein (multidrug efflux system)
VKRFIIIAVFLILLAVICVGIVGFNFMRDAGIKQYFATMKPPAATVSTVIVKPSVWTPGVEAIGSVNAVHGVDLTLETSGIVKQILFRANQKVAADAVLVQLDDAVEKADLVAQKAQAASDQAALTRAIELQRRGVGTDATLDAARAAADASAAQVNKLQAVLDQKQLSAPFGGTVGIPKIDIGQYLAPGNAVVTIQDLDTMRVDFTVPEQQLPLLKIGQTMRIGGSLADLSFAGSIRGIDPKIDPASRLVSVRGEVANPEGKLTPGQFVQIRVELPQENNVISVPQTAVTTSLYGDYVFVVVPAKPAEGAAAAPAKPDEQKAATDKAGADAGKPQADTSKPADNAAKPVDAKPADAAQQALTISQVFVKLGRRNDGMVEITEGLKDGDQVVTAGQNRLFNGMSVAVDNTIDPSKSANKQVQQ